MSPIKLHTTTLNWLRLFLIFCFSSIPIAAEPGSCVQNAEIVKKESEEDLKTFRTWIQNHKSSFGEDSYWLDDVLASTTYFADIDNNGVSEYVVETSEGSGHYTNVHVFRSTKDGFDYDENAIPTPDGAGDGWYSWSYVNPVTKEIELLTKVCGKVYISFVGSGELSLPFRASYVWEKGKTEFACDSNWINYNRSLFKKLYERKSYGVASDFLRSVVEQCEGKIDSRLRAWIYNDLAITHFHLGHNNRCTEYVNKAKADQNVLVQTPDLKRAIETNESLCKGAPKEVQTNFDWLLDPALKDTNEVVISREFDNLLAAIVPDLEESPDSLRHRVKGDLHGPPDM